MTLAQEYFGALADQAFGLGWGLKALAATGMGAKLSGHAIRAQVEQMARTFIAGSSVTDATPALKHLWTEGKAWSVDLLGEATISDQEACPELIEGSFDHTIGLRFCPRGAA